MPYWVKHRGGITDLEKATDVYFRDIDSEPCIRAIFPGDSDYTDIYGSNAEQVFDEFVRGHSAAEVEE